MAIQWKPKLTELRSGLSALADQGPADVLKLEGEAIAKQLESAGETYDQQSRPKPATDASLSAVVVELDMVASLVDGSPPAPSTFAIAKSRLTAALPGANAVEATLLNRALAVSEPGEATAAESSGVQNGTQEVYNAWSKSRKTVPKYFTRGELETSLVEALSAADQWLTLVSGL